MPALLLGPVLRHVGDDDATIWVETDAPCEVAIRGSTGKTFTVEGHHYALVHVTGLTPGEVHPYEVELDGDVVWPPEDYELPGPTIRAWSDDRDTKIVFGSCRVSLPHEKPYVLPKDEHPDGREFDALFTVAKELQRAPREEWPDLLLMLGDQVYVDEGSPAVRDRIRLTRDTSKPPGLEVANFEEYTWLYRESWGDPMIRWLLSTVSTAMVIDDHDMADDWNISASWVEEMREQPWWADRVAGGLMSYWIYQHIGNLTPADLAEHREYEEVTSADDGGPALRRFVEWVDRNGEGKVWSFSRDFGRTRLIVADDRTGRQFGEGHRSIFDEEEWEWINAKARGDFDHFLIATTDPVLLAPGFHYIEAWSEAVCDGAWGSAAVGVVEKLRRAVDLDHWPSFGLSFHLLVELMEELGSGKRGTPPASITLLSGDVHHAYVAEVAFRRSVQVQSAVHQAVCSPFRNALEEYERNMIKLANTRGGTAFARALARSAGAREPDVRWRFCEGPYFDNQVASICLEGREATIRLEKTKGDPDSDERSLDLVFERRLTGG